jgi:PAS domain S-box-containing protein
MVQCIHPPKRDRSAHPVVDEEPINQADSRVLPCIDEPTISHLARILMTTYSGKYQGFPLRSGNSSEISQRLDYNPALRSRDIVLGESTMRENSTLYSKLVKSLDGIVWEANGETFQFTFVSPQAEKILGYPIKQWLEPNFWRNHTHPDDTDWCAAFCLDSTQQRRDHEFEYRMIAADGSIVWLHDIVSVKTEPDGRLCLRGIMLNITERRRNEEERQRLLQRLITAHEDERRHLSRELHDNIDQYLSALLLGLESLARIPELPTSAVNQLSYLKETTKQFELDVHSFALELRPTVLDELGLEAALSTVAREWGRRHDQRIKVVFNSARFENPNERLPFDIEVAIYRVVQEALTNASRHSNAEIVSVILERNANRVRVIIEDDGDGFDAEQFMSGPVDKHRLGLMGMQERVQLAGGEFKIESGAGTTLVVTIPLF